LSKSAAAIDRAKEEFRAFHWGNDAETVETADAAQLVEGDVLVVLGELNAVEYITTKGEQEAVWCHDFGKSRPKLCTTASGRLVIVGGGYRVTPRGIVG